MQFLLTKLHKKQYLINKIRIDSSHGTDFIKLWEDRFLGIMTTAWITRNEASNASYSFMKRKYMYVSRVSISAS